MSHRWTHRTILVASDFANAGLMLILVISPAAAHPALMLALPVFMGLFQGTFHVALYSQSQHFLGLDRRHHMNSLLASIDGVAVVAGGILASAIYDLVPVKSIFLIDATTFLISGLVFIRLTIGGASADATSAEIGQGRLKGVSAAVLRTIVASVGLLFAARFVEAFGSATHNVGFPILSTAYDLQNHAFLIGWIMAIWGLGKIVATMVTPAMVLFLGRQRIRESRMFLAFLMSTFAFFLGVFFAEALWAILAFAFLAGLFDASTETVYYAILQQSRVARTDQLISLSYLIERAGMGLGIILVGYAYSIASTREISGIFYLGSIAICSGILTASLLMRNPDV